MDSLFDDVLYEEQDSSDHESMDIEEEEIHQEEVWKVIDEYFKRKGLVGQQIDSFDEFIRTTIQEVIDDSGELEVIPENQFVPGVDLDQVLNHNKSIYLKKIL